VAAEAPNVPLLWWLGGRRTIWKSCMTDQDRHDGRRGFDWDQGESLESDAEPERQHREALQEQALQAAAEIARDAYWRSQGGGQL
jgi:fatty-acid desaturase